MTHGGGALCVAVFLLACRGGGEAPDARPAQSPWDTTIELSPKQLESAEVRVVALQPTTFSPRLKVAASLVGDPRSVARVGARVPGRVAALDVALGMAVKKGQPLVEIDSVELHQVTLDYFTARARVRFAEDSLRRQRQLTTERIGSQQELRRAQAEAAAAQAALGEAEEHLHFLGLSDADIHNLKSETSHGDTHSTVRAPIDGRVAALPVTVGQVLSGTEDVATIADIARVWVTLQIYERDLASVSVGAPVSVAVPAFPQERFPARLSFLGDLVDPVTRVVAARAELLKENGALRPGMSATALVELRREPSELWVPVEAVQPVQGKPAIFVQTGEGHFQPRRVKTGSESYGLVPLRDGIEAGNAVVVHGAFALLGELERATLGKE